MFDKNKFAQILKKINETYNSQRDFAKKSEINRTYLSQYMNMKLNFPPQPKTLKKLANNSNGVTTYENLMIICGYINNDSVNTSILSLYEKINNLEEKHKNFNKNISFEESKIAFDLHNQLFDCLFQKKQTPETFNPNEIIEDIDYISDRSKKNIAKILQENFEYLYHKEKISKKISDLQWKSSNNDILNNDPNIACVSPDISFYMCPVYGQISTGQPNWAEENIEGRIPIDTNLMDIVNPEEHFFLRVNGESMNKVVKNGAFALIHKQDAVNNGEIAVVLVNGFDATLKKFTKQGDLIILEPQSDDEKYETQVYDKNTSINILGKYVGKMEINK